MKTHTFKKGAHPPEKKELTSGKPIKMLYPQEKAELLFPVQQHIGAPCEPLVAVGERVLMGQKIADSKAMVSSPIRSSVSGEVKGIRETLTANGATVKAIAVENDGKYEEAPEMLPRGGKARENYAGLTREQRLEIIRDAGIVGLGGAGFPTHVKLNPPPDKKIEYIIVNAAECEPYLTTDHRVLLEETDAIVSGLRIVLGMFPGAKGIIAIENNKPDAIKVMDDRCGHEPDISVIPLKTKYPQGSEKHLIFACTGRQTPSGGLPADVGAIVDNVDTVIAIDRAIRRGRPLIRRVVTLSGGAVKNPGNYKVLLGTTFAMLLDAAGGLSQEPARLISGGPMMGFALYNLDIPITKTASALLCLTEDEVKAPPQSNCIRCGRCVGHCPIGLVPLELEQYAQNGQSDLFIKNNGMDCIECGCCTFVCPAKRQITQALRVTRRRLLAAKKK